MTWGHASHCQDFGFDPEMRAIVGSEQRKDVARILRLLWGEQIGAGGVLVSWSSCNK